MMLSQPRARLQVWHHQASLHSKVEQPEARPSQRRQWRHPSRPARCFLDIVPIQRCCVDPNGPRIPWVHCSGTWTVMLAITIQPMVVQPALRFMPQKPVPHQMHRHVQRTQMRTVLPRLPRMDGCCQGKPMNMCTNTNTSSPFRSPKRRIRMTRHLVASRVRLAWLQL